MGRCSSESARRRPPSRRSTLLPRATWGVVGLLARAGQASAAEEAFAAGCLIHGYHFTGELPPTPEEPILDVRSPGACQELCVSTTGCRAFSYWPSADTGHEANECRLYGSAESPLEADSVAISGPEYCEFFREVCTSAAPTTEWPSRAEGVPSAQAWPRGFQPGPFQCYAADESAMALPCRDVEVIQDSTRGWPGRCEDFDLIPIDTDCEEACRLNASCAVFAVDYEGDSPTSCYMAPVGRNCRLGAITPVYAKRFARAHPRYVEANVRLAGIQIMGLENVYNVPNMEAMNSTDQEISDCRATCASVFGCSLWQLSQVGGCYIEMPSHSMQAVYPLQLGPGLQLDSELAPQMIAGGFVEQVCTPQLPPEAVLTGNLEAVFTFTEMDFAVLSANDTLLSNAKAAISEGVAALAGQPYTATDVITLLVAGSVVANSTVVVDDPQVDREALARRLQAGLDTESYAVISRLQAVPGISDACNGALPSNYVGAHVVVTQAEPPTTTGVTTTTTTAAAPVEEEEGWSVKLNDILVVLVSFCFLSALLVAAYCAIISCQRDRKRSARHMSSESEDEQEDEFDKFDDDKSGGISREEFIRHYTEEQARARARSLSQPEDISDNSSTAPLMVQAIQPPPVGYSNAPPRTASLVSQPNMARQGLSMSSFSTSRPMYQPVGGNPMYGGDPYMAGGYPQSYPQGYLQGYPQGRY